MVQKKKSTGLGDNPKDLGSSSNQVPWDQLFSNL